MRAAEYLECDPDWLSTGKGFWHTDVSMPSECTSEHEDKEHQALTEFELLAISPLFLNDLTISCEQQKQLRQAVQFVVSQTGRTYRAVYRGLHDKFHVYRYHDILAKDFNDALKYLQSIPDAPELFKPATNNQTLLNQDGRWLVIVKNATVEYVRNIDGCNCVDADAFRKLLRQTKQQAEYLIELAKRMRVVHGECATSRLDVPIEELHPKVII